MDKNKYYTPELEEFHIGFEFEEEFKNPNYRKMVRPVEDNFEWVKLKLDTSHSISRITSKIKNKRVRVKYLDENDLIELGFTKSSDKRDPFTGQYVFGKKDEIGFNTGTTIQITLMQKGNVFIEWESYSSWGGNSGGFQINICNKTALKKLLKDLRLI